MPNPVLYCAELSPHARAVRSVAAAIHLELDERIMNMANGEHFQEWYLKLNPQHTVPTLVDNGTVMSDSHAICGYLVDKYGTSQTESIYPTDLTLRARVHHRLHFNSGILFPALRNALRPIFAFGATQVAKDDINVWFAGVEFLETFLQDDEYLVGSTVTLADICCVETVINGQAIFELDAAKYPKTSAWVDRLMLLPYIQSVSGKALVQCREFIDNKLEANKEAATRRLKTKRNHSDV